MLWGRGPSMMHVLLCMHHGRSALALLLCWLVSAGSGQDGGCDILEVSVGGSSSWPFEGLYTSIGPGVDGRTVYKHTCHGMHIFYSNIIQPPRWFMGADPNRNSGYAYTENSATYPQDITGLWQEWSGTGTSFTDQGTITIQCQADTACPQVMVWGPDAPNYLMGVYSKTGETQNSRPVYKHNTDSVYLYHQQTGPSCQRWILGPEVGLNLVTMYASSATFLPPTQDTAWTLIEPTQQRVLNQVYITCAGEVSTTTTPAPVCGERKINSGAFPAALIFNGQDIDYPGKWPFAVSIFKQDNTHKCAGTLVGSRWVLTAGHCATASQPWGFYTVVMGTSDLDAIEPGRQVLGIRNVFRHDNFVWDTSPFYLDYDIILLELTQDVAYTDYLQPACLPSQGETLPFREAAQASPFSDCWIMGWGLTTTTDISGGILQEQSTEVGEIQTCAETAFSPDLAWAAQTKAFCAYPTNAAKLCKGDSGSPLMCKRDDRWTLVGMASWSIVECTNNGSPSVYTDVTQFLDWINEILPSQ